MGLHRLWSLLRIQRAPAVARRPVRLVVVQGPQQLLAASAVIEYQRAVEGPATGPIIAVIGHLYAPPAQDAKMKAVCYEIVARGGYERMIDVLDIDLPLRTGKLSFDCAVRLLRERIGDVPIEVVYVARNGQSLNEMGLAVAGEGCRRITYGDALGFVESDNSCGEQLYNPSGYASIREAWLTTPVECQPGLFDKLNIVTVPAEYYLDKLRLLCSEVEALGDLKRHCQARTSGAPVTLCLTSNLTEATYTATVEDEIGMYAMTARPLLDKGAVVIIKGHPRESRQSHALAERLTSWGIRASALDLGSEWPGELLSHFLNLEKVLSFCSATGIILAWSQRRPTQVGFDSEAMRALFSEEQIETSSRHFRMFKLLVRQAFARQFALIRYNDPEDPSHGFEDGSQLLEPDEITSGAVPRR